LEGEHLVPFEERAPELIAAHRQFLQQGYDQGRFLLSGPSVPPKGGVLIARAESIDELNDYLADEPYCKAKVMRFAKVHRIRPSTAPTHSKRLVWKVTANVRVGGQTRN
jgi:uncharacterized protein YciI